MPANFSVLEGAYLRDLLAQPQALADTVAGLRALPSMPERAFASQRIVLTGIGSSLHGLYPLHLRLVRADRKSVV